VKKEKRHKKLRKGRRYTKRVVKQRKREESIK
jgi:hypothetical protein